MLFLYELFQICAFHLLSPIFEKFGNEKAQKFVSSRKKSSLLRALSNTKERLEKAGSPRRRVWVHVASAGELEQAIPPLRSLVESGVANVFLTYFSPSTEPFLKNAPFVSGVSAFPLDARSFHNAIISKLSITDIVLVRYDFWPALFSAAKASGVSLHLLGATPLPSRKCFHFLGGRVIKRFFFKQFKTIFTVNQSDVDFFQSLGVQANVLHAGDPKWARAKERAQTLRENKSSSKIAWLLNALGEIKSRRHVVVFGSPHADEHAIATQLISRKKENFYIYAPHECDDAHVTAVVEELKKTSSGVVRFSETLFETKLSPDTQVLVIDKIGHLAEIYSLASIAIVGGGFDGQIHNTLEPAAHPVPTLFGNNVGKSPEALTLVQQKAAITFSTPAEMLDFLLQLGPDDSLSKENNRNELLSFTHNNCCRLFESIPDTCSIIKNQFLVQNNHGTKHL